MGNRGLQFLNVLPATLVFFLAGLLSVAPMSSAIEETSHESEAKGDRTPEAVVQRYLELQGSGNHQAAQNLFDHTYFLSQAFGPEWSDLQPEIRQEAVGTFQKGLGTPSVLRTLPGTELKISRQSQTEETATVMVQNPTAPSELLYDLRLSEQGWRIWNIRNEQTGLNVVQEARKASPASAPSSAEQPMPSPLAERAEVVSELEAMHHQAVVIAGLSQQFDFIGYLEGISRPGPVVARVKGLFPRATMPAALWRDATHIQGAQTMAPSKNKPRSSDLLLVDALVSSGDLAFAKYDGSSKIVAQDQLEMTRQTPLNAVAVKLIIERQSDGQWGFLLPNDRREFERKASEMGL